MRVQNNTEVTRYLHTRKIIRGNRWQMQMQHVIKSVQTRAKMDLSYYSS